MHFVESKSKLAQLMEQAVLLVELYAVIKLPNYHV